MGAPGNAIEWPRHERLFLIAADRQADRNEAEVNESLQHREIRPRLYSEAADTMSTECLNQLRADLKEDEKELRAKQTVVKILSRLPSDAARSKVIRAAVILMGRP